MSGIAGIIHFGGAPVEPGLIEQMTAAMAYRGPDGIHHRVRGSVALGQCMLRTTPESLEETQPLTNEDESLVLVMDGRVDNWEELRQELLDRDARLRDPSDAELILRSYETWGQDCLRHIDGDFALIIWDARRRTAFCARDRLGNRPFNYHWDGKTLTIASEVHAILGLPWVRRTFNSGMLAEFLGAAWSSRDETFWKGISRLVAAHLMEVGAGGPSPVQYWEPELRAEPLFAGDEEYVDEYRRLLADIVRCQSRSYRPVACEVSGGLDSSAIFAVAEGIRRQGRLPAPGLEGYTLDFRGVPEADEMNYARAVGMHLDTFIQEVPPAEPPVEWYRRSAREYGEFPGYPNGAMALRLRETARARGSRVLLSGVGGDEWLGLGPPGHYYAEELALGQMRQVFACLKTDVAELGVGSAAWWAVRSGIVPLLPESAKRAWHRILPKVQARESWLAPPLQAEVDHRRHRLASQVLPAMPRRAHRWQMGTLRDPYSAIAREMEERAGARLGIELRKPFFDRRIVQFAFSTPERLRSAGRSMKRLHRRALRGSLPASVLGRQTKADFMVVFRRQLDQIEEDVRSVIPRRRSGWIRPDRAACLVNHRREPGMAGWVEWWLWTLVGCDALV